MEVNRPLETERSQTQQNAPVRSQKNKIHPTAIETLKRSISPPVNPSPNKRFQANKTYDQQEVLVKVLSTIESQPFEIIELISSHTNKKSFNRLGRTSQVMKTHIQTMHLKRINRGSAIPNFGDFLKSDFFRVKQKQITYFCIRSHMKKKQIKTMINGCTSLTSINFENYSPLKKSCQEIHQSVIQNCPQLTSIDLRRQSFNDANLQSLAENCPQLSYADFSESLVGDDGIKKLSILCTNLTEISVMRCRKITNTGVQYLLKNCKKLASIDLSGCRIDDTAIPNTKDIACNLSSFYLTSTKVTDAGVQRLVRRSSRLTYIEINRCKITDAADAPVEIPASYCAKYIWEPYRWRDT